MRMYLIGLVLVACALAAEEAKETAKELPPVPIEDAKKLVEAKVGEGVLLAWAESLPPYKEVDADTILKLKEAKVPEKAIEALVRGGGNRISKQLLETLREVRRAYTTDDAVRYAYSAPRSYDLYDGAYSYWPYTYSYYGYPYYSSFWYGYPYSSYRSCWPSFQIGLGGGHGHFGGHFHGKHCK